MKRRSLAPSVAVACLACVEMPASGDAEDLSALSARYDGPTAVVPDARVNEVIASAAQDVRFIGLLAQLRFVKTLVSDTSAGFEGNSAAEALDVRGVVDATFSCPGDGPLPTENGALNGLVRARFGVHSSRLKRGFTGALESCLLRLAPAASEPEAVLLSGRVVADLGADLPIGDALTTPLLLKLNDLVASATGLTSGDRAGFTRAALHFRITAANEVETLVDASDDALPDPGSFVIGVREDGALYVRDRLRTWTCTSKDRACAALR